MAKEQKPKKALTPEEVATKEKEHRERLDKLQKEDPVRFGMDCSFKDYQFYFPGKSWGEYCDFKANSAKTYWADRKKKGPRNVMTEEKLDEKEKKLQEELARIQARKKEMKTAKK